MYIYIYIYISKVLPLYPQHAEHYREHMLNGIIAKQNGYTVYPGQFAFQFAFAIWYRKSFRHFRFVVFGTAQVSQTHLHSHWQCYDDITCYRSALEPGVGGERHNNNTFNRLVCQMVCMFKASVAVN